jgi:hypothetical protein
MNNQEILDNAPEGATHVDSDSFYKAEDNGEGRLFWEMWNKDNKEWWWCDDSFVSDFNIIRSLSDIKRIVELEYRVAELVIRRGVQKQDFDERIEDLKQQAKGVKDFFASVEPKISIGESKLWELQTHNVNCYLDNLRNQAKGGAE